MKKHALTAETDDNKARVLTKAVLRTADILELTHSELAEIIGISPSGVTRLHQGTTQLRPGEKPFELGALLVRLYRSLSPIVGEDAVAVDWLRNENTALNVRPIDHIQSVTGLVDTVRYLDARRAAI